MVTNTLIGVLSAIVDNIPVMYAVLQTDPAMSSNQVGFSVLGFKIHSFLSSNQVGARLGSPHLTNWRCSTYCVQPLNLCRPTVGTFREKTS